MIKNYINTFLSNQTNENFSNLIEELISSDVILLNKDLNSDLKKLNDNGFTPLLLSDKENKNYIPLFTDNNEIKGDSKSLSQVIYKFKELCNETILENEYIEGFILNPFTDGLKLPKPVIEIVYKYVNEENVS